jgi:two-component system cell cycle response regulator
MRVENLMGEPCYKILLVEDNEDHVYIFKTFLSADKSISLEPVVAACLDEAINLIRGNHFDLVLLDLMLPDSKGINTFVKLHYQYPEIPVVVITSLNDSELGIKAAQLGAQDYLIKEEINSDLLRWAILFALGRHGKDENLRKQALIDELSQLYNRRGFISVFQQYLKIAQREGQNLLLIMVDVDGLKSINDTYGHLEGDRAIIDTGKILKSTFRGCDLVGRTGGDEFVVLAVQASDENAQTLRERLQNKNDQDNSTNANFILSLSVGVTRFDPQVKIAFETLLAKADDDLYDQKRRKHRLKSGGENLYSGCYKN